MRTRASGVSAAALLLSACSGGGGGTNVRPNNPPLPSTTPTPPPVVYSYSAYNHLVRPACRLGSRARPLADTATLASCSASSTRVLIRTFPAWSAASRGSSRRSREAACRARALRQARGSIRRFAQDLEPTSSLATIITTGKGRAK